MTKYGWSNWIRPRRPKHGISDTPAVSGPSLRTTRCLRRHLRYYAPVRHPHTPEATAMVFPRRLPPAVTARRAHPGFPGSDGVRAYMMRSMTPALPDETHLHAPPGIAFGHGDGLGSRDYTTSWLHTHPACSLSTLRRGRYQYTTQDSLRGVWSGPIPTGLSPTGHRQFRLVHPRSRGHVTIVQRRCSDGRKTSPSALEYRRQMVELVRVGRTPGELAREFECSVQAVQQLGPSGGPR